MGGGITGRRKLRIFLCDEELRPWDPFCRSENTRELDVLRIDVPFQDHLGRENSGAIIVSPVVLPREDEFSSAAAFKDAAGPRNWNQQQGFYFYRNNRLLQSGGWSWLRAIDEHTKGLRVAVDFPQSLDRDFELNITKMRARIPASIRERIRSEVSKWIKTARERYDRKPSGSRGRSGGATPIKGSSQAGTAKRKNYRPTAVSFGALTFTLSNAPNHRLTISGGPDALRVVVPQSHPAAALFSEDLEGEGLQRLAVAMLSLLEAVFDKRLKANQIPLESLRRSLRKLS
jgi:hypothetical protein